MFGGTRLRLRQAVALTLSLLLHLTFGMLFVARVPRRLAERPIEVSIVPGAAAPASGARGEGRIESAPHDVPEGVGSHPAPGARRAEPRRRPRPPESPATAAHDAVATRSVSVEAPAGAASTADAGSTVASAIEAPAENGSSEMDGPSGAAAGSNERAGPEAGEPAGHGFSVSGAGAAGSGRSYASIWNWTQRYLSGLRDVYDRELQDDPRLHGVMVVRYEILASGAIGDVAVVSTELGAPGLERGVLSQIRRWRYPPEASGDVVVTWPFSFEPPR